MLVSSGLLVILESLTVQKCENAMESEWWLSVPEEKNLLKAAEEDGADLATDDWRKVIEHPDVNYVVVGTPDAFHHEAVMAAAAAGKHLFCEKPLGMNAIEAREMTEAYLDAKKLAHFVPLWTRWSPGFVAAKELVQSGAIGEIKAVVYRWHNPRPMDMALTWRDDPNSHLLGRLRMLDLMLMIQFDGSLVRMSFGC